MDHRYMTWFRACRAPAAAALWVALLSQSSVAETGDPVCGRRASYGCILCASRSCRDIRRRAAINAARTKRSCIVSGLFSDCNDAAIDAEDSGLLPDHQGGGTSTAFSLSYCIPDVVRPLIGSARFACVNVL